MTNLTLSQLAALPDRDRLAMTVETVTWPAPLGFRRVVEDDGAIREERAPGVYSYRHDEAKHDTRIVGHADPVQAALAAAVYARQSGMEAVADAGLARDLFRRRDALAHAAHHFRTERLLRRKAEILRTSRPTTTATALRRELQEAAE